MKQIQDVAERKTQIPDLTMLRFVLVLELLVLFDFFGSEVGREEPKEQSRR